MDFSISTNKIKALLPRKDHHLLKINVGGKKLMTTLELFEQFPSSNLALWFKNADDNLPKDDEGYYFLDRDPNYFCLVLDYLRCPDIVPKLDKRLQYEFDYYGIQIKQTKWTFGESSQLKSKFIKLNEDSTVAEKIVSDSYALILGNKELEKGIHRWKISILALGTDNYCSFGVLDMNEIQVYNCHSKNYNLNWSIGTDGKAWRLSDEVKSSKMAEKDSIEFEFNADYKIFRVIVKCSEPPSDTIFETKVKGEIVYPFALLYGEGNKIKLDVLD